MIWDTCNIKWLVFIAEIKSVYTAVRTGTLNRAPYINVKGEAVQKIIEFLENQRRVTSQKRRNSEDCLLRIKTQCLCSPAHKLFPLKLQLPNLDIEFLIKGNILHTKLQIFSYNMFLFTAAVSVYAGEFSLILWYRDTLQYPQMNFI